MVTFVFFPYTLLPYTRVRIFFLLQRSIYHLSIRLLLARKKKIKKEPRTHPCRRGVNLHVDSGGPKALASDVQCGAVGCIIHAERNKKNDFFAVMELCSMFVRSSLIVYKYCTLAPSSLDTIPTRVDKRRSRQNKIGLVNIFAARRAVLLEYLFLLLWARPGTWVRAW